MSLTISTVINGTLTLAPGNNPVTILGTGGVQATATGADAIDGDSSTAWMISNAGTVSSTSGFGLYLNGPSSNLSNSGSISGVGGMFLNNDGSVTNSGTITATGKMPSSLATISGIYVTGPSGAGMSAISVSNSGVITAADGYGIGLGASGSVNNSGTVTGGEDGVVVVAGVGNIQNSGSITATLDNGVTSRTMRQARSSEQPLASTSPTNPRPSSTAARSTPRVRAARRSKRTPAVRQRITPGQRSRPPRSVFSPPAPPQHFRTPAR